MAFRKGKHMKVHDIVDILEAEIVHEADMDAEILSACGKLYDAGLRGGCNI